MRRLVFLLLVTGCSGSDALFTLAEGGAPDDGSPEARAPGPDAAPDGPLHCLGAATCRAGELCCAVRGANNVAQSTCQTACSGDAVQLCDPKASPTGCLQGTTCQLNPGGDLALPPGLGACTKN
jgi:hypothetical protein